MFFAVKGGEVFFNISIHSFTIEFGGSSSGVEVRGIPRESIWIQMDSRRGILRESMDSRKS